MNSATTKRLFFSNFKSVNNARISEWAPLIRNNIIFSRTAISVNGMFFTLLLFAHLYFFACVGISLFVTLFFIHLHLIRVISLSWRKKGTGK